MRIVIVGCGYVGLVTGTCLAHLGHDVVCIDRDQCRISALRAGRMPIYEQGLGALVATNVAQGRLSFASAMPYLDASIDAVFIAVGTPTSADGKGADLSALFAVVEDIVRAASVPPLIVVKSTVPVGTCDAVASMFADLRPQLKVRVASNPEFLKEGSAVADFLEPDRIVIGTQSGEPDPVLAAIYAPLCARGAPLFWTSTRSAELIKHASNAFLATKIAFINEIADLCERSGADVRAVAHGMGLDRRIGATFLEAGPGYGGSCFPKDCVALLEAAETFGASLSLLEQTVAGNLARRASLADRVSDAIGGDLAGKRIAVFGLAFKAGTDDCRESPALELVRGLLAGGAFVTACDPKAMPSTDLASAGLALVSDAYECARGSDCAVLATAWPQFQRLVPDRLGAVMANRCIVDLRNALDPAGFTRAGFVVHGIGRSPDHPELRRDDRVLRHRAERQLAGMAL